MNIEQFFDEVPFDRLQTELAGKEVVIEVLVIDNHPMHLASGQMRYQERFPSRQPTDEEVRDFLARHYTPFLSVWNQGCGSGCAGVSQRSVPQLEGVLDHAVQILCMSVVISGLSRLAISRDDAPDMEFVQIATARGATFCLPLRHEEGGLLSLTIASNPITSRREYCVRFYNTAVVISLPA